MRRQVDAPGERSSTTENPNMSFRKETFHHNPIMSQHTRMMNSETTVE